MAVGIIATILIWLPPMPPSRRVRGASDRLPRGVIVASNGLVFRHIFVGAEGAMTGEQLGRATVDETVAGKKGAGGRNFRPPEVRMAQGQLLHPVFRP